jgi:quercetin dioxygenase-like cupin family protein
MKITRISESADGVSHFQDIEVALEDAGEIGRLSEVQRATGVIFRETSPGYDFDWHPAPRRQYIVLLDGNIEITVGDGETRRFTGGDILLVEDTTGRGHRTRTTDGKARRSLFITLD